MSIDPLSIRLCLCICLSLSLGLSSDFFPFFLFFHSTSSFCCCGCFYSLFFISFVLPSCRGRGSDRLTVDVVRVRPSSSFPSSCHVWDVHYFLELCFLRTQGKENVEKGLVIEEPKIIYVEKVDIKRSIKIKRKASTWSMQKTRYRTPPL